MRRQDVKIGVEYAATAPLAYGREPRTAPKRVRFTDTRPGPWGRVVTMRRTDQGRDQVNVEIVNLRLTGGRKYESLPRSLREAFVVKWGHDEPVERKSIGGKPYMSTQRVIDVDTIPDGGEVTYLDATDKGGLPGEVWRRGGDADEWGWYRTLVVPAEVHREWSEVEAKAQVARERDRALDEAAKIPEINAFLAAVGLDLVMRAYRSRSSAGDVSFAPVDGDGDTILAALTAWAQERRPGGWGAALDGRDRQLRGGAE